MTNSPYTVAPATLSDAKALESPIIGCGLFAPEEADGFIGMLPDLLTDPDKHWLMLRNGDAVPGAAYLSLEAMSEDVWNLWFIGLVPDHQGKGGGQMLLAEAEAIARANGGRLMLIDTSSDDDQAPARRFYMAAGYRQEAQIADYYAESIDKVTFRKVL
ncbi:MAG: GNAT family N-acetyltransferase [Pseudomonadota bacterium]